jgi:CubicO group peptidase (beta-lactamase class C family)
VSFAATLGQPAEAQRAWTAVTRRFDAFAKAAHVVGGSAVLVRDGRIAARHHYGFADRASGRRVGDSTIYHWASVTKTLTAIAVLQLRDRGLLDLDDPITRWVPELRIIHDPDAAVDRVTLRMLLSHSSGFQAPTWPWDRGEPWEPFEPTHWSQLVAMMPYQRLEFPPGSRYGYSNPGYIYLARVVEQLTGDPWAVYVQKNIWTPLAMDRSYVGATPYYLAAHRSHGHRVAGDSVTDLGAEAWTPTVRTGAALPELAAVGLGFFSLEHGGHRIVGHTGDQAGYRSYVYLDPAASSGIILVFNTTNDDGAGDPQMAALAQEALAALRR